MSVSSYIDRSIPGPGSRASQDKGYSCRSSVASVKKEEGECFHLLGRQKKAEKGIQMNRHMGAYE